MNDLTGKYRIYERKSSGFGMVGSTDIRNELSVRWPAKSHYDNDSRFDIYITCLDKYQHDQLARAVVNLIVNAIFNEKPDFQGDDDIIKRVNQIIDKSEIDWSAWGADLEVNGDVFIRAFLGEKSQIVSIPARSLTVEYDETNILNINSYTQFKDEPEQKSIQADEIAHIKINNTANMVYGSSTLRPVLWWLDVLDNLWDRNALRAIQYYGAPIVAITGVPVEHQAGLKSSLETDGQRPGRNWVFPADVKVEVPDFTKNYPIQEFIDRVYQYILSACNIPQHLVYESDSSRGVAMFSGDSFEMMIKNRRRAWELGLIRILRHILQEEGLWQEDSKLRIGWKPVFQRDLKDLTSLIQMAMDKSIFSKRTARERLGVDHSEEVDRIKTQKDEEPDEMANAQISKLLAPAPATKSKE